MSVKLYVGNLPFTASESEITDLFAQVGNVARVQLIHDKMTGRPRGFGFVEMSTQEEAQAAISRFNGNDFNGRSLTVNEARPMEPRAPREFRGSGGGGGGGGDRERRGGGGGGYRDRR
jgi:cold-inducible RNA-binding protein